MYTKDSEPNIDLRVKRTRKLLWEALLALMDKRSFESISVNEICEKAMVHRTTFYKHFEDKYHLLSYGLEEMKNVLLDQNFEDLLRNPIRLFEKLPHQRELRSLLQSDKENSPLRAIIQQHFLQILKNMEEEMDGKRFPMPITIIAEFYSGALYALASWWLRNDMPVSAEEMDDYLDQLIKKDIIADFLGDEAK